MSAKDAYDWTLDQMLARAGRPNANGGYPDGLAGHHGAMPGPAEDETEWLLRHGFLDPGVDHDASTDDHDDDAAGVV